ncbi:hypothetical protein [Bacillus sp. RAR_GA_16]|uniref:hypothetical protein n=1 Tax=Bacillus sp. RAR_GA_16 TaxID=2876774 RepID=UPI001CC8F0C7|nr:hypothetical protein [Bacillus sp. RAR_GA_16]MCA0173811.1 hypothetical protein [Bacillus sp. RAR_GA_16]
MSVEKLVKETKLMIWVTLFVSLVLFATWVALETTGTFFINNKAFLALSLIPFSAALASSLKLMKIRKHPQWMVSEIDERLVAEKDEAEAKTLKSLQGLLFLSYLGYTFVSPEEIFQSIGWWNHT